MMLHNPRNILGLDGDGWLREITVNDADPGLEITQAGAGAALSLPSATTVAKGLILGGDVALYRSAANVWASPDRLEIARIARPGGGNTEYINIGAGIDIVTGGATNRIIINAGGSYIQLSTEVRIADTISLNTGLANDDYFTLGAVDNDTNTITELVRATGAAQPSLDLLLARFGTVPLAADAAHRGMLDFTEGAGGVADKLHCIMKGAGDAYSRVQIAIG